MGDSSREPDVKLDLNAYLTDERVRAQIEAQARRERAKRMHGLFASLAARTRAVLCRPHAPRPRATHCG